MVMAVGRLNLIIIIIMFFIEGTCFATYNNGDDADHDGDDDDPTLYWN